MSKTDVKNRITSKVFQAAKSFAPQEDKKRNILESISSHIRENPLTDRSGEILSLGESAPLVTPYREYVVNAWRKQSEFFLKGKINGASLTVYQKVIRYVPITLLALMMLGGGTALAANSSLPGDFLYPFKRSVSEKVKALAVWGEGAAAKIKVKQACERLEEARELAFRGKISEETKVALLASFGESANEAKQLISDLEARGDKNTAEAISTEFKNLLKTHQIVFAEISTNDKENKDSMVEINNKISIFLDEKLDSKISPENSAEEKIKIERPATAGGDQKTNLPKSLLPAVEINVPSLLQMTTEEDNLAEEAKIKLEATAATEKEKDDEKEAKTESDNSLLEINTEQIEVDVDLDDVDIDVDTGIDIDVDTNIDTGNILNGGLGL